MLSDLDREFLTGLDVIEKDQKQLQRLRPHVENIGENATTAMEVMEEFSRVQEDSPFAALYAGVLNCTENGDFRKAKRLFEKSVQRISVKQKVMGDDYLLRTKKSLMNNIAVCSIYLRNGAQVARFFQHACEGEAPFAAYHNAQLYLESTDLFKSGVGLSRGTRKKLIKLIALDPPEEPSSGIPERLLMTTLVDVPMTAAQWSKEFDRIHGIEENVHEVDDRKFKRFEVDSFGISLENLRQNDLHPVLWCMRCNGDGFCGCTNAACMNGKLQKRSKVRAGTFPTTGDPIYKWSTSYREAQVQVVF